MPQSDRIAKWLEQLDICHQQVIHVASHHEKWKWINSQLVSAPWIGEPGNFMAFVTESHLTMVAMLLRRLQEDRDDVVSLVRLLKRVRCAEVKLSRANYVETVLSRVPDDKGFWLRRANAAFTELCEAEVEYFPEPLVARDIDSVIHATRPVVDYVDQRVAHWDKGEVAPPPLIAQVERAFSIVIDVQRRYHLLATGTDYRLDTVMLPLGWNNPLRTPWITWSRGNTGLQCPIDPSRNGPVPSTLA